MVGQSRRAAFEGRFEPGLEHELARPRLQHGPEGSILRP